MKKVSNIVFNPFKNDSRVEKISKSLAKNNYKVEVIAHLDKGVPEFESKDGYDVRRFIYFDRKVTTSKLFKLFIYLKWITKVIQHTKSNDILHCNDLNTLPIGVIVKKFFNKNVKIVYDAHEYESERCYVGKTINRISRVLEKLFLKYVDEVITVSDSIANEYVRLYNIKKPALVLNTPPYKEIEKKDIFRDIFNIPQDYTIFLYQGGLSEGRGILEFFELVKDKEKIAYVVMGYGQLEEEIKRLSKENQNLYFHEAVTPSILLDYTSSADIGVCIEENLCKSWDFALPNKMFEYFMADLPIIVSGLSEMKRFVKDNDTGWVIEDIFNKIEFDKIYKNITLEYEEKVQNVKKIKEVYNWQEQERVLLNVYKELEK